MLEIQRFLKSGLVIIIFPLFFTYKVIFLQLSWIGGVGITNSCSIFGDFGTSTYIADKKTGMAVPHGQPRRNGFHTR